MAILPMGRHRRRTSTPANADFFPFHSRRTMSQIELRPGLADVPVAESAVSYIDGKRARLEYRGIAVENLARESCFEETSWLLLKGDLPTQRELACFDEQL